MTYLNYQLVDQNVPHDLPAAFFCEVYSYCWISDSYSRREEEVMKSAGKLHHVEW